VLIKDKGYSMACDLITLAEYKAYAGINSTNQDNAIKTLIPQVSKLVKELCRRTFTDYVDDYKTEVVRGGVNSRILLHETPVLQVTSVEFSDDYGNTYTDLIEFEDYVVDQEADAVELIASQYANYRKVNAFRITYNAGYEVIPSDLKLAIADLITYYLRNEPAIHSNKNVGANSVQIEYVTNTGLPAHIRRVFDLHTAFYG
jgi:hypothetical protein